MNWASAFTPPLSKPIKKCHGSEGKGKGAHEPKAHTAGAYIPVSVA